MILAVPAAELHFHFQHEVTRDHQTFQLIFHSQHWVVYILESGKPDLMLTGSVGKFDGPYHTPTIFFLGFTMLYVKLYHKHLRVSDIESSDSKSSNDILSLMRDKYNSMLLFQIVYCFGKSRHI